MGKVGWEGMEGMGVGLKKKRSRCGWVWGRVGGGGV